MKILFTADLHLLRATQDRILQRLRAWIVRYRPDAVVVAGDLSSAPQADETLKKIRGCFPQGPLAVCLGNHDFWLHDSARNECHVLSAVIDRYWVAPAKSFDIVLLDVENLSLSGFTIVGAYGHYDLGFAVPDLAYDGVRVTEEDYLRGSPFTGSPMRWRDFQLMPSGLHPREVALQQVEGMKRRLSESGAYPSVRRVTRCADGERHAVRLASVGLRFLQSLSRKPFDGGCIVGIQAQAGRHGLWAYPSASRSDQFGRHDRD